VCVCVCVCVCQGRAQDFSVGARPKGRRPWGGMGSWGGATPPASPHQLGLGERCELPSGVRGGDPTVQRFSSIFSTEDGLCWHYYTIVNRATIAADKTPWPLAYDPYVCVYLLYQHNSKCCWLVSTTSSGSMA